MFSQKKTNMIDLKEASESIDINMPQIMLWGATGGLQTPWKTGTRRKLRRGRDEGGWSWLYCPETLTQSSSAFT